MSNIALYLVLTTNAVLQNLPLNQDNFFKNYIFIDLFIQFYATKNF